MRIGLIKKMMGFGAVVAILMGSGGSIPAYAADAVTVTGRRMFLRLSGRVPSQNRSEPPGRRDARYQR